MSATYSQMAHTHVQRNTYRKEEKGKEANVNLVKMFTFGNLGEEHIKFFVLPW